MKNNLIDKPEVSEVINVINGHTKPEYKCLQKKQKVAYYDYSHQVTDS